MTNETIVSSVFEGGWMMNTCAYRKNGESSKARDVVGDEEEDYKGAMVGDDGARRDRKRAHYWSSGLSCYFFKEDSNVIRRLETWFSLCV
ncbi:hypothetical protein Bca4012_093744 [Brassica carinata]